MAVKELYFTIIGNFICNNYTLKICHKLLNPMFDPVAIWEDSGARRNTRKPGVELGWTFDTLSSFDSS